MKFNLTNTKKCICVYGEEESFDSNTRDGALYGTL